MMFPPLQCLLYPRSAVPYPCPGTQHSGSFYSWCNHPASWQSWSADLESNIYTNTDLDIYVCVWFSLLRVLWSKNSKLRNAICKHLWPFLCLGCSQGCWNLPRWACRHLVPFQAPCRRRAYCDMFCWSFLQHLKSPVSPRFKARLFAGREMVDLIKSSIVGIRQILRNHGPGKKKV